METPPHKPLSRQQWQHQLQPLELPADPAIKARAIHKLHARAGNADNVAEILMDDPGLVLRLVCSANRALTSTGNEVKSLAHAISLLGVPATEQLLRSAPELPSRDDPVVPELKRQYAISHHAAYQLQAWAGYNSALASGDLALATLLHRAPLWVLWHQAPEMMIALQHIQLAHRGGQHEVSQQRILGCTLQSLAAALSRQWQLPTPTQMSWYPSERGSARQWVMLSRIIPEQAAAAMEKFPDLQRLTGHHSLAIALANRLAEESDWDWYSRRTLRLQHILAVTLHRSLPQAIAVAHRAAATASRRVACADHSPAARLLGFYQRHREVASRNPQPRADTAPPPPETAPPPTESEPPAPAPVADFIAQLHTQPQAFNDLHGLFNRCVETLCSELGFERACTSLLNERNRELRTYYSSGCDDSPGLKQFRHTLKNTDLFNKLFQRPLCLRLQPGNYRQIWPLLPGPFKQACGADQFVMMSVFVNRRPLALVYADCGNSNRAIGDDQYRHFKALCYAISHCLSQRTSKKL